MFKRTVLAAMIALALGVALPNTVLAEGRHGHSHHGHHHHGHHGHGHHGHWHHGHHWGHSNWHRRPIVYPPIVIGGYYPARYYVGYGDYYDPYYYGNGYGYYGSPYYVPGW